MELPNDVPEWLAVSGEGRAAPDLLESRTGRPPRTADASECRVIFDGSLHNAEELRGRFRDRLPREASDADLVAQAYRFWGDDALLHMKGRFALIIWDQPRARLLAARDPLGTHPLYFAETAHAILFSPSIRTLLAHPGVSKEVNRPRLVDYLTRNWTGGQETCFAHVSSIAPGHALRSERGRREVHRYWNPLPPDRPIEWIPDSEAQERFDALLEQAVGRCLAAGPAGIYLSGGLDSAMVAVVAADLCARGGAARPRAFSVVLPEPHGEQTIQRGVAAGLGMQHALLPFQEAVGPGGIFAAAFELNEALPEPLFNFWAPAFAHLSLTARQQGCEVILTGEGGDEWLGVSPDYATDLLRSLDMAGIFGLWRSYARFYPTVSWASLRGLLWSFGARPLLRDAWPGAAVGSDRWRPPEPWIAPDPALRTRLTRRRDQARELRAAARGTGGAYALDVRSRLDDPRTWLRTDEAYFLGRRSGISVQDPFWDADLVDLLARTRPGVRSRDSQSKALVRGSLARRFPYLGFESQTKHLLGAFIRFIIAGESGRGRQALGDKWILGDLGIISPGQARAFLGSPGDNKELRVWDLLNLEAWARAQLRPGS